MNPATEKRPSADDHTFSEAELRMVVEMASRLRVTTEELHDCLLGINDDPALLNRFRVIASMFTIRRKLLALVKISAADRMQQTTNNKHKGSNTMSRNQQRATHPNKPRIESLTIIATGEDGRVLMDRYGRYLVESRHEAPVGQAKGTRIERCLTTAEFVRNWLIAEFVPQTAWALFRRDVLALVKIAAKDRTQETTQTKDQTP